MLEGLLISHDGPVCTVTMNRPERRNALDLADRLELAAAFEGIAAQASCRVVVLTGAGSIFCAGGDLASMSADPSVANTRMEAIARLVRAVVSCPMPVVTAVQGGAFGMGLALAILGDVVICANDARMSASYANLGLTGDGAITWSLCRRIGVGRAKALMMRCSTVRPAEALSIGLVDEVVAAGTALDHAQEVAQQLASASAPALAATKRIFAAFAPDLDAALTAENEAQIRLFGGADFAEGRAAFYEHRRPEFSEAASPGAVRAELKQRSRYSE